MLHVSTHWLQSMNTHTPFFHQFNILLENLWQPFQKRVIPANNTGQVQRHLKDFHFTATHRLLTLYTIRQHYNSHVKSL